MLKTAIIMAGGKGERFWPKSRQDMPKQFLSLSGDGKSMLQLTVERISGFVSLYDTFVVTNNNYKALVLKQLPGLPEENIICEPEGRNTAPCIGLGAAVISTRYKDADPVVIVLASDHMIKDCTSFSDCLESACNFANDSLGIVTIGIKPNYPETGYGYICYDTDTVNNGVYKVSSFTEKPDRQKAEEYLKSGKYLWNSGMFVWNLSTIKEAYRKHLPDMYGTLEKIKDSLSNEPPGDISGLFSTMEPESVDYGIMEKSDNIYIIPGDFGWDDVGSWPALSRINETDREGNYLTGNVTAVKTRDCIIDSSSKRLVATLGIKDLIIVDTEDVLLVTDREHASDIKELTGELKKRGEERFL